MQYMIIMTLIALMQFVVACVTLSYNDDESRRAIVEVFVYNGPNCSFLKSIMANRGTVRRSGTLHLSAFL
jgi:hypothetical protein